MPSVSPLRLVFLFASLVGLCLAWSFGCIQENPPDGARDAEQLGGKADALARIAGPQGSGAHAFVRLVRAGKRGDATQIIAELSGFPPGQHGFHIHEHGRCDGPGFDSAGEHFAGAPSREHPEMGKAHGMPHSEARHAGDMGNVVVDGRGTAHIDRTIEGLRIDDVIGRAIIVHESGDDGKDIKSAGGRIACGVIEKPAGVSRGVEHSVREGAPTKEQPVTVPAPLAPPVPPVP